MKDKKILLVVDMQNGFIMKENEYLIDKINSILDGYDKVYLTKFKNTKNSLFWSKLKWKDLATEKKQELAIDIPQNSQIVDKYSYGLDSAIIQNFITDGIKKVDICGLSLDACVYAISLQLFDNGIFPNILINYTETEFSKEEITKMLLTQFGSLDYRK